VGGVLNASVNCLDRHLPERADQVAVHWEGEPGDRRTITYGALHAEVATFADALRGLGVAPGDRVALHLGWIPEAVVAMLACARIGAVHGVLPASLPADALADRAAPADRGAHAGAALDAPAHARSAADPVADAATAADRAAAADAAADPAAAERAASVPAGAAVAGPAAGRAAASELPGSVPAAAAAAAGRRQPHPAAAASLLTRRPGGPVLR